MKYTFYLQQRFILACYFFAHSVMNMDPYQTYQENPRITAYQTQPEQQFRDEQFIGISLHAEGPPRYPASNTYFQNANKQNSEERRYGQTLLEQHKSQETGDRLRYRREHRLSIPEGQPVLLDSFKFTTNTTLITSPIRRLERPIAIPQICPGTGQSFLRAWAPILQNRNITVTDFIMFIDNLNVVSTASPPLQILGLAGGFVGMVPHHFAQLAGYVIQGSAKLGTALVSKGRTEMYMQEVNETIFQPRGLKSSLASTEAMRAMLRIPANQPTLAPLTAHGMALSMVEMVLTEIAPYNTALDLNVPPPRDQITTLAKLSAKQVMAQEKKTQKKMLKDREKAIKKEEERRKKVERKMDEKRKKKEKKQANSYGEGKERLKSNPGSAEDGVASVTRIHVHEKKNKEEKKLEKLLWIVIEDLRL